MGNINPIFNDRVRYILKANNFDTLIVTEPIGWETDEKEYARHENYHGIFAKFSNSLKFIDSGRDYINLVKDVDGINAEIQLTREEKHPHTDEWTLTYSGYLDLSTWQEENNQVSVKFNSGGLEQLLKSRESEKVEIDRLTTIDGKELPELNTVNVNLEGRRIFLKTKYNVLESENSIFMTNQTNGQTRGSNYPVPLSFLSKSHENAHQPIPGTKVGDNTWNRSADGQTGLMFFLLSDRPRRLKIKIDIKFSTEFEMGIHPIFGNTVVSGFDDINFFRFWLFLGHYENGSNYDHKENHILYTTDVFSDVHFKTRTATFEGFIDLLPGDSLALSFGQNMDGANGHQANLRTYVKDIECEMTVDEDSYLEPTQSKAVLAHELGERLVSITTNTQNRFYSDYLGRTDLGYPKDGKAGLTAFTHGFWLRGFDKFPIPSEGPPVVENLFKPMTTSFKEFVESMAAVWNVGVGIEKVGLNERIRIEEMKYFYNRNVTIRLANQVKNVKRTIATDKYYSSLEFGFKEGGEYEEACGLDEYNTKSTFTTIINRVKNVYSKISEYRADSYGMEFARRKQKDLNDTEDTSYDNKVFFLDLKRFTASLFKERKFQDDFENPPTGVFSPETATNLRFSPLNCLLRHSWWISGCLTKHLTDYSRYASSESNSNLKTKLRTDPDYLQNPSSTPGNGKEYAENANILNSELLNPVFLPEEIEFEYPCGFQVMEMVNRTSTILGKQIPNIYGLVEFINEKNEIEKGFLLNLKPNGKGVWKLLKANI
jgi:hypothetical protein